MRDRQEPRRLVVQDLLWHKSGSHPPREHAVSGADVQPLAGARARGPIVIVAGAIAPYTNRLYDAYAVTHGDRLHVLTCVDVEPQRKWQMPVATHYHLEVLPGLRFHRSDLRNIYVNPAIVTRLAQLRPRAVLIGAFSPTMALAALYAFASGTPFGVMTDGSVDMDPGGWSSIHRRMRRMFIPRARVGVGASDDSRTLLEQYGLPRERSVEVPIVCPWPMPETVPDFASRPYDVLFCGAIEEERKGAGFFADVLIAAKAAGHTLSARIAGDGPLRPELEQRLAAAGIPAHFDGFVQPADLPAIYASAKVFAFPSRGDPWGLVVNEAMQCGTPVIGSPHAISSLELVGTYQAGEVLALDVPSWRDALVGLLTSPERWQHFSRARERAATRLSLAHSVERLHSALSRIS